MKQHVIDTLLEKARHLRRMVNNQQEAAQRIERELAAINACLASNREALAAHEETLSLIGITDLGDTDD